MPAKLVMLFGFTGEGTLTFKQYRLIIRAHSHLLLFYVKASLFASGCSSSERILEKRTCAAALVQVL